VLVLVIAIAAGFVIGNDFGVSTDEYLNVLAGKSAASAYAGVQTRYSNTQFMSEHGPAYFMIWAAAGEQIGKWLTGWTPSDGRHFFNYGAFLMGVLAFFVLMRKVVPPRNAFMAALLFMTQPMLFGYAFINQKDIPFMILFMASITAVVVAVDRYHDLRTPVEVGRDPQRVDSSQAGRAAIAGDWWKLSRGRRIALGVFAGACAYIAQSLLRKGWMYSLGSDLLRKAYSGDAPALIQRVFSYIATDAYKTSVDLYLAKLDQGYRLLRLVAIPTLALIVLGAFALSLPALRDGIGRWARGKYPPMLLAGGLLGLTISVRQIGFFAGALASLYLVNRIGRRALTVLGAYWLSALLTSLATWPYLWPDPIGRFWHSVTAVTGFGTFRVLYAGTVLTADRLPWHYFPTLASLELTEPAVLLFLVGLPIIILRARSGQISWAIVGLLGAWLAIPVAALMLLGITVYDNLRHMLFVLPPMLILSGVGLDAVLRRVKSCWGTATVLLAMLAPGILGIIAMHPYEYAYFNSFIGGVSGADGRFETDHWCTSYREAIGVVNERAEPGETVVVPIGVENAKPFQRGDLKFADSTDDIPGAEYVLYCPGAAHVKPEMPGFVLVHQVTSGDAVFAEVWELQDAGLPKAP